MLYVSSLSQEVVDADGGVRCQRAELVGVLGGDVVLAWQEEDPVLASLVTHNPPLQMSGSSQLQDPGLAQSGAEGRDDRLAQEELRHQPAGRNLQ